MNSRREAKERLKRRREIECKLPSGEPVIIRPLNLELHAISGGLPARLREIAMSGVQAVDRAIHESAEGDWALRQYLDRLVCKMFVEPEFEEPVYKLEYGKEEDPDDPDVAPIGTRLHGDDLDEYLLPVDYRWALLVCYGEEDYDGDGMRLWGREPLSRWAPFRAFHGCPEDCEACSRLQDQFSLAFAHLGSAGGLPDPGGGHEQVRGGTNGGGEDRAGTQGGTGSGSPERGAEVGG